MRLILVGVLVAAIGCGSGAEPADYAGTGGTDAGATADATGGAPGTGGAAASCNIQLAMVNGTVTSATSTGTGAGSGPTQEFTSCATVGANYAQFEKSVTAGQPDGDQTWVETSLTVEPADGGCAVEIGYARTENPWDGGVACDETMTVTLTVAPR